MSRSHRAPRGQILSNCHGEVRKKLTEFPVRRITWPDLERNGHFCIVRPTTCPVGASLKRDRGSHNEGGIVPSTYDRRTFLTHSAATVGGVAMAGTVVDTLISDAASAVGLAPHYPPSLNGTLNVAVSSSPPTIYPMNGWQGHWDAAGCYVGAAIFDPLFYINAAGNGVLPGLALSAVGMNSYKTWRITLRS